jgi:HAMP domain-containing protein
MRWRGAARSGNAETNTKLKLADLELDRMTRRVTRNGKKIELTAREFQLLEFMMRHSGQVVTRTMLLEGVWDYHFDPQTNVIDVHISRLRQAIDKDFDKPAAAHGARRGLQPARRRIVGSAAWERQPRSAVSRRARHLAVSHRHRLFHRVRLRRGGAARRGRFRGVAVVDGSTDNLIEAEVQGLREQVLVLSRSDFIELIEQRSQDQDVRGAVYLMVDPQLRPVAGNVPAWPKIDANEGKWIQFKVSVPFGDETREHEMRAQRFPLPGGYRMLVGHDVQERQDVKNLMMRGLIAAVVLTLLLGLGGGFWMGRRILAQAGAISAVATQIMRGDLSQRLPVRDADDEINTLAREINGMLDKIEQLTLGMRTVLDSAAHDLRTPLNRLQATAEGAMSQLAPGSPSGACWSGVTTEVDHMRSTLDALLRIALAETGTVAREPVDLSELVASMVELYAPVSEERGIALESAVAPGAQVQGSRQLLAQALANLLDNAIKFTPDGGRISACCCAARAGSRRSSSRTTGRAFRPTSARSCSAGACGSMRRENFRVRPRAVAGGRGHQVARRAAGARRCGAGPAGVAEILREQYEVVEGAMMSIVGVGSRWVAPASMGVAPRLSPRRRPRRWCPASICSTWTQRCVPRTTCTGI